MDVHFPSLQTFLRKHLNFLPCAYIAAHGQYLSTLFFILGAMDLTHDLSTMMDVSKQHECIEWIYSLQHDTQGGFRSAPEIPDADVASTYSAILCLLMLGDNLNRIHRKNLNTLITKLAGTDGGYHQYPIDSPSQTSDLRFTYCVVVIAHLLNLSVLPIDNIVAYVQSTYTFDGSFGSSCTAEAHGGYTYCAVATLSLLNRLPTCGQLDKIIRWCLGRQGNGFAGRINKNEDTCYSFWIGASLKILGAFSFIEHSKNFNFLAQMQSKYGGFGREDPSCPDLLHTYFAVAALSLMNKYPVEIAPLIPNLNLSERAYRRYLNSTKMC